jgi:hypothetical protein
MNTYRKVNSFNKRWNVTFDDEWQIESFRNRILYSLDRILGDLVVSHPSISDRFAYFVGIHLPSKAKTPTTLDYEDLLERI